MGRAQNRLLLFLPNCFDYHLSSGLLQIIVGKKWMCGFKANDHPLMFPKHCEIFWSYGQQKFKTSLWRLCWNAHSEDEMRLYASFQLLDFLYCAKPCTNYLASKPKGPSQEKSRLNAMHHMLSSVMHWLQESIEKNPIFSSLNFKDQADVQMTYIFCFFRICFFIIPFQLSGILHLPPLDRTAFIKYFLKWV